MWEDNNPLSFDNPDDDPHFQPYDSDEASRPGTQDSNPAPPVFPRSPSAHSRRAESEDEEDEEYRRMRREKGYSSRVEQMLLENKNVQIVISDAGKNHEGSGGFIVYTIRTGDLEVRRRYSEFESLRKNLSLLHPCLIVPPIPEKQSVSDYVTAPTSAKENVSMIDHRKRMLGVFLQRCALMTEIRYDSVFQRFLDPNASWSEVLSSPPIINIPKQHLRAPPLNPSEPTAAHAYLPIPSASAKLRPSHNDSPSGQLPGNLGRLPPPNHNLAESELDPYFNAYEASTRQYEALLTGSVERVNRRILKRLHELCIDYHELGGRYNAWSLGENQSQDLNSAIEKVGKAVDDTCIRTAELARALDSGFAEPLRESAQFAGVVQKVLRYRVLKRIQEDQTRGLLAEKRQLLDSLEKSEAEARRIEAALHDDSRDPDIESLDSDTNDSSGPFPPNHAEPAQQQRRNSTTSKPAVGGMGGQSGHRKSSSYAAPSSSGNIFARGFGKLGYAIHGVVDVDPERTRRDNIGKTKELLVQLEGAEKAVEKDVEEAGRAVLKDLRRFQREKVGDMRAIMREYAKGQIEWARRCEEAWQEAGREVGKIQGR
ncbi:hypothetical protein FPQ18DRAFT_373020 [Pyronema domesticum]|uniref:Similar to Sorting nexin-41 acc. no. Q5AZC9 n=1 Tax=Pyronema omphalodes (strain CBS 100304) TaxID=1076935 RepID=U4LXM5_PYROM|nr:hypothetical protein FPQ18DRAFT_373020 [Pyronema domesticum]CCX34523.1 Similar to Sorting nexin-41; acc. no. Q5AZC9 [Pyronema omphalodes CBS 100304]